MLLEGLTGIVIGKAFEKALEALTEKLLDVVADKLSQQQAITPVTPTAIQQDPRYQDQFQQFLQHQQQREEQLLEHGLSLTEARLQKESHWAELSHRQQEALIDQYAHANSLKVAELEQNKVQGNLLLRLKAQEMADLRQMASLQRDLLREYQEKEIASQINLLEQGHTLNNWCSKLSPNATKELLRREASQNRLLLMVSSPDIAVYDENLEKQLIKSIHPYTKREIKTLTHYFSTQELEKYCDYFNAPVEDIDIGQLQNLLGSIPTAIFHSSVIGMEITFNLAFWAGGRDTFMEFPVLTWDFQEMLAEKGMEAVGKSIASFYKLLAIYVTDWYYLNLDLSYEPVLLRTEFEAELLREFGESRAFYCQQLREIKLRQQAQLQIRVAQIQAEQKSKVRESGVGFDHGKPLQVFEFDVICVDSNGLQIKREIKQAEYFVADLGDGIGLEMVKIPAGTFQMGTDPQEVERLTKKFGDQVKHFKRELPPRSVNVPEFYLGKYLVTQAQWQKIMGNNPAKFQHGENYPVENISWHDCQEFLGKLNGRSPKYQFRLPSEAEWEYACRAGTKTPFAFGEAITSQFVNFDGNSVFADEQKGEYRKKTTPVGSFYPNNFGLYDLHGNLWEWCEDSWHENYVDAPTDGSDWSDKNITAKILRGGSWVDFPNYCRSANRYGNSATSRSHFYGFRVACL